MNIRLVTVEYSVTFPNLKIKIITDMETITEGSQYNKLSKA